VTVDKLSKPAARVAEREMQESLENAMRGAWDIGDVMSKTANFVDGFFAAVEEFGIARYSVIEAAYPATLHAMDEWLCEEVAAHRRTGFGMGDDEELQKRWVSELDKIGGRVAKILWG